MKLHKLTRPLVISTALCFASPWVVAADQAPAGPMKAMMGMVGAQSFVWKNFNSNFNLNESQDKITGGMSFESMEGAISGAMFKVDPFDLKVDLERYKPDSILWLGKVSLMSKGINVNTPDVKDFKLSNLGIEFSALPADKVFNAKLSIKYDSIAGAGLAAGAADYLRGPFHFEMSANNLDLANYDTFMKTVQTDGAAAALILAKTGGEISLDNLKLSSPEGDLSVKGKIVIPANPELKDIMQDKVKIVESIGVDISCIAPVAWVKKIAESGGYAKQIDAYTQQGMLKQTGDNYTLQVSMKKGVLYFSEQPFINVLTILTAVPNQ